MNLSLLIFFSLDRTDLDNPKRVRKGSVAFYVEPLMVRKGTGETSIERVHV